VKYHHTRPITDSSSPPAGFEPIQSLAPEANLRIVALTRRGYIGSSPYTESELQGFQEGTREALEGLMAVLVAFMRTFVEKEKIPRRGGISIMGWSIGNLTTMSLFSDPGVIDGETRSFLEAYLKDIILYGTFLTENIPHNLDR
jgi:hypothetical protein